MIIRPATLRDIYRFALCEGVTRLQLLATFALVDLSVIEDGEPLLLYGSHGGHFTIFPSAHIRRRPLAFARATHKAYSAYRGSGLKCQVPRTETRVIAWAHWLGTQIHGCSPTHLEVVL